MILEAAESLKGAILRVAGYDFQFRLWTHLEAGANNRWGECSIVEQIIRVQEDMPTRFKLADTVLHEITHAIWWAYGIYDEDKEERVVCVLGTAWMQIYRDNPWLLEWLRKTLAA